jgi:hypothetical protein
MKRLPAGRCMSAPLKDSSHDLTDPVLERVLSNSSPLLPQLQMLSSVFGTVVRAVCHVCPFYYAETALSGDRPTVSGTGVASATVVSTP